jgi:hypothetical protein
MPMTQYYLCGELATRLARLECVADQGSRSAVHQLRRDAELSPPSALCEMARRALVLADLLCWDALGRGEVAHFADVAAIAADLHDFATCARLIGEEDV